MKESRDGGGIAGLPHARGQAFHSLDLPWWRQVAPGIYERVTRMPGRTPERATRAELMRRFGFTH